MSTHVPVLKKEVLKYLAPEPNKNYIDCTFGRGGHALAILEKNGPDGKVLGIEVDSEIFKKAKLQISSYKFQERLILVNDSYINLETIVRQSGVNPIHGILFDLGMSSWHLERSGRGFSFQKDENLDMRYNLKGLLDAQEIVNRWSELEIQKILQEYGEERFARRIAEEIVRERKKKRIETTSHLVGVVKRALPSTYRSRINPATRVFQALRIAVNSELENIRSGVEQALEVVEEEGVIVVISFHSLEDRIIKNFFRENAKRKLLEILTKKPVVPQQEEIKMNIRSRSAKLRAARKIIN